VTPVHSLSHGSGLMLNRFDGASLRQCCNRNAPAVYDLTVSGLNGGHYTAPHGSEGTSDALYR